MDDSTLSITDDDFERVDGTVGGGAGGGGGISEPTSPSAGGGQDTDETSARSSLRSSGSRSSSSGSGDGGSFVGEVDTGPSESDLLRIMECPVCAEFPIPPIYNCSNGHFTCNECISLLTTCSLCEAKFTQVRNYALESIIESTKFKCRYNQQGCKERVSGAEYRSHLDVCPYGPAICNERKFTQCEGKVIERVNYVDHLYLCHNGKGVDIDAPMRAKRLVATFLQSKGDDFSPLYLTSPSSGQSFFVFTKKYKSFFCWWVASLKPEDPETAFAKLTWSPKNKFLLTATDDNLAGNGLEFENDPEETSTDLHPYGLQWTLPIHSLKKPFNEIRDSGLCAVLPDTHMQPFSKTKIVTSSSSSEDNEVPEVEWNLTVEVVQSNKTADKNKKPDKPFNLIDTEIDWQKWLEKLRLVFPLLALMFMIVGIGLLAAIYIQTSSSSSSPQFPTTATEELRQRNEFMESQSFGNGNQNPADMKPYPHLNDRQDDIDYEGYRGFYYNRDKIRNGPEGYKRDQDNSENNGEWKNWRRVDQKNNKKGRKGVYGSGAPEHDDEFVGYRGFYHQKTPSDEQQNQDHNQEEPKLDTDPKTFAGKMGKKVLSFIGNHLSKFFKLKPPQEIKNPVPASQPDQKFSVFGIKIEGLDFVGVFVAKIFFFTFCVFCLITALALLTAYKRWIYSSPPGVGERRARRTSRGVGTGYSSPAAAAAAAAAADTNIDEPLGSFDDFVRRRTTRF